VVGRSDDDIFGVGGDGAAAGKGHGTGFLSLGGSCRYRAARRVGDALRRAAPVVGRGLPATRLHESHSCPGGDFLCQDEGPRAALESTAPPSQIIYTFGFRIINLT